MDHTLLDNLSALGFTEYEGRVYLALLHEHPATGYQISVTAGIPRSMVYEALGRLDQRGAVLKSIERRATLYRPVPPEQLLDRYQREQEQRLGALRRDLQQMFTQQEEELFWSIRGRDAVLTYANQMLGEAAQEILLVLCDADLADLRSQVHAAAGRGIQISALLTGVGELGVGQVLRHPPLESELQEVTTLLVLVVDRKQVLIANSDQETHATITNNPDLVMIARQFIWMELFTQRITARIGAELLSRLDPQDRLIIESYASPQ